MSFALPLRDDFDSMTLRRLARRCIDNRQIRRLLALAAVYDGMNEPYGGGEGWRNGSSDAS